jgi:hypothetical protein
LIIRDFTVVGKGLKGKHKDSYIHLESDEGDKLILILPDRALLGQYEIGQEFTVKVGDTEQTKLP